MRYELTDHEWMAIKLMLPNKPRGVPRVNDRRVLNGIFWVLQSGAPWRDLPDDFGPYTTCYNRFVPCILLVNPPRDRPMDCLRFRMMQAPC
jgi:transposase